MSYSLLSELDAAFPTQMLAPSKTITPVGTKLARIAPEETLSL
jgi:hypothetical protein